MLDREHWEALEADLLAAGFTIADIPGRVSWRAVAALAQHSYPGSAFFTVLSDEETQWPRVEQLLAVLIDAVNNLGWLYTTAHSDTKVPPPDPFPRPGVGPTENEDVQHIGADPIPREDFHDWWARGGG